MRYILLLEYYNDLQNKYFFLRKEPKYLDLFKKMKDNGNSFEELEELYDRIKGHKNTLKQQDINLLELGFDEDGTDAYEKIIDVLQEVSLTEKFNKFSKLLPKHLRDDIRNKKEYRTKFKELIIEFNYNYYKKFLSTVAKIKDVDTLIKNIEKFLDNKDRHQIIKSIEDTNGIELFIEDKDYIVAIVYSREASCELGVSQWCISTPNNNMWNHYVEHKSGVQYFVWDLTLGSTNPLSKIGITIYKADFDAFDKANNRFSKAMEAKWWKELKDVTELNEDQLLKYLKYNTNKDAFIQLSDEKKKEVIREKPQYLSYTLDSIYTKEELDELIMSNPNVLLYLDEHFFERVKKEMGNKVMDLAIKAPLLLLKHSSMVEKATMDQKAEYICSYFKYDNYHTDKLEAHLSSVKHIFNEELQDPKFLLRLLDCNPSIIHYLQNTYQRDLKNGRMLISDLVNKYESDKDHWNESLGILSDNSLMKKYFINGAYKDYVDQDLYIFNGSIEKKKVGTSDSGKNLFEEVLDIERMLKYNPLITEHEAKGMKMRSKFESSKKLRTYGIWTSKNMFAEEGQLFVDRDVYEDDQMIKDLIQEKMFEL